MWSWYVVFMKHYSLGDNQNCVKRNFDKSRMKPSLSNDLGMHYLLKMVQQETIENVWNKHCVKSVRIRSFSGLYFSAFRLNTERYGVSLSIQSECWKYGPENSKYGHFYSVKTLEKFTWNQVHQIWLRYVVFIKHSPIGHNHLKIFKNNIWKEIQKRLLYPYFDSLIPAVFYAEKFPFFMIASAAT